MGMVPTLQERLAAASTVNTMAQACPAIESLSNFSSIADIMGNSTGPVLFVPALNCVQHSPEC